MTIGERLNLGDYPSRNKIDLDFIPSPYSIYNNYG
tara:strand:- start:21 stop:125 length:105 start_codon:yes stop_codon:yes gene_type:complete